MSLRGKQNKAVAALTVFGVLVASNYYFKPPMPQSVALRVNRKLDQYNERPHPDERPHPEQDRMDTILDRTQLLDDAKRRKPWNMTMSERSKVN